MKSKNIKRNNNYTFMFFPEGMGTPFTLRVHRYTLRLAAVAVIVLVIGVLALIYKAGEISLRLQMVHNLRQENIRLRQYAHDLELSSQKIAGIDSMTAYLHRLAGLADIGGTSAQTPAAQQKAVASQSAQTVQTAQVVPPVQQTVHAGAASARRPAEGSAFAVSVPNIMPVDGWITKRFSKDEPHNGIDIAATRGTPIRVTAPGTVEDIRTDKYTGLTVEVRHENGFLTRYSHCSQILVNIGDRVNRGQTIALVGNTGRSTAPHVHYEVLRDGKYVDPMSFIRVQNP